MGLVQHDQERDVPEPDLVVPGRDSVDQVGARNSTVTGAMRELRVAADLMERGHEVFRNLAPSGIDLVACIRGELVALEVTTGYRTASGQIRAASKAEHYRFDALAIILADGTIAYYGITP